MVLIVALLVALDVLSQWAAIPLALAHPWIEKRTLRRALYAGAIALVILGRMLAARQIRLPPDYETAFGSPQVKLSLLLLAVAPAVRAIRRRAHAPWVKAAAPLGLFAGLPLLFVWHDRYVRIDPREQVPDDAAAAAAFYQRRCDRGNSLEGDEAWCVRLGWQYQHGEGVRKDLARGAALYGKACDLHDREGCFFLGFAHQTGAGVGKDVARAADLYAQSCRRFDGLSCLYLGRLYETGEGVAKDRGQAATLYEQACNQGAPGGCTGLGHLYRTGQGVAPDPARAAALFRRACDFGHGKEGQHEGCFYLGSMYENGEGMTRHTGEAVLLYKRACEGQIAEGCEGVSRLAAAPRRVER